MSAAVAASTAVVSGDGSMPAHQADVRSLRHVPIASLRVRPQVRTSIRLADVRELAASIQSVGLQQPILCALEPEGTLRVVDGHHRLMALELLGRTEAPVLVIEGGLAEDDVLARQLVCSLQRIDLDPIDRAEGTHRLMESAGLSIDGVAKVLGRSPATVSRSLRLMGLPAWLRDRVRKGEIPADTAYLLAGVENAEEQRRLAERVAAKSLTRDGLARELKRSTTAKRSQTSTTRAPDNSPLPKKSVVRFRVGEVDFTVKARVLSTDSLLEAIAGLAAQVRQYKGDGTIGLGMGARGETAAPPVAQLTPPD